MENNVDSLTAFFILMIFKICIIKFAVGFVVMLRENTGSFIRYQNTSYIYIENSMTPQQFLTRG